MNKYKQKGKNSVIVLLNPFECVIESCCSEENLRGIDNVICPNATTKNFLKLVNHHPSYAR